MSDRRRRGAKRSSTLESLIRAGRPRDESTVDEELEIARRILSAARASLGEYRQMLNEQDCFEFERDLAVLEEALSKGDLHLIQAAVRALESGRLPFTPDC